MSIEFIPAVCPNCGGELRVPNDKRAIKCMYCGYDIIIYENNKNSYQPSVENLFKLAESEIYSNPSEAYEYYKKILEFEPENWKAWYGKAKAAGNLSSIENPRLIDVWDTFQKVIYFAPKNEKEKITEGVIFELVNFSNHFFLNTIEFAQENEQNHDVFDLTVDRINLYFFMIDNILEVSLKYPNYIMIAEIAMNCCKVLFVSGINSSNKTNVKNKFLQYLTKIKKVNPDYEQKIWI